MSKRIHLALVAMSVALSACAQPKEDPRVAELQKELAAAREQVAAANKDAQAGAAATQAAGEAAAGAALETAKSAQAAVATQTEQASKDRANTEKMLADHQAATEKAIADQKAAMSEQKAAAARTADENARLRSELESMKPQQFTLPAGTVIPVRTTAEVSTSKVKNGSVFDAVLEKDLVIDGTTLAKAGALVTCVVVESDPGGRVKGVASLSVAARSIAGVGGNTLTVKTESYSTSANSTKKKDTIRTGIATGAGAIIGGIAGGGKGAAIGAGAGAATGVGVNAATRGEAAVIPTETLIQFSLSAPATVVIRK